MGGKKNRNKKKNKQDKTQSEAADANQSPAANDDNTVTPEQSSVAKEGGIDSVSNVEESKTEIDPKTVAKSDEQPKVEKDETKTETEQANTEEQIQPKAETEQVETQKQEEAKTESNVQADLEGSTFEVVNKSQTEQTDQTESVIIEKVVEPILQEDHIPKKEEVKAKRPKPNLAVGVEKLKIDQQMSKDEIQSPMKIKQSDIQQIDAKNQFQMELEPTKTDQKDLEQMLNDVTSNFEAKKKEFEILQQKPQKEILQLYAKGDLKDLVRKWQKELEMNVPQSPDRDNRDQALIDFNNKNKDMISEIEHFMLQVEDWCDENLGFTKEEISSATQRSRPPMVGIEKLKLQSQNSITEVQSPFKKKQKTLRGLNLSAQKTEAVESDDTQQMQKRLELNLKQILENFDNRKKQFEELKNTSVVQIHAMIESKELRNIPSVWQKDFDLQSSEETKQNEEKDNTQNLHVLHDFMSDNKKHFNEIEHFMHELNDWIEEQIQNYQSSKGSSAGDKSLLKEGGDRSKDKDLMKAEDEARARKEIQQKADQMAKQQQQEIRNKESREIEELNKDLNNLAQIEKNQITKAKEDDDLLKGLEELKEQEKRELDQKRATFTPRDQPKQDQQIKDKPKPKEKAEEDNGWGSTLVIVGAISLAIGLFVAKKVMAQK